ncbi:MAG: aromatic amino acid DMT transporter YddG [Planctomycetes bacterium]|nr:aromatic amino acid DMT transporter YddG [Planctomycetota bacterium]
MLIGTSGRTVATAQGLLAILLWSTTFAVSRSLAEQVGVLTAGSAMLVGGGVLGCLYVALVERRPAALFRLPRAYLLGCGVLFVAYMVCLFPAIGLAASRQQTLEVGIINYLWPGLTLLFSIPILRTRVRRPFFAGIAMAAAGAALAPLRWGEYSAAALAENLRANPLPYGLALVGAVVWALYSTLSRRWASAAESGAVPLFTLAAGLVLAALRPVFDEPGAWTWRAGAELAFMAVCPVMLAYALWDRAVRKGNLTLVAAASYLAPLLSTVLSALYLGVDLGWNLWLACGLLVGGAALAQWSVVEPATSG